MTTVDIAQDQTSALAREWGLFRHHCPIGANLPIGQEAGDCRDCHTPWPCLPVRLLLAEVFAAGAR